MPDLTAELRQQPWAFGFFQAVSLLEELLHDHAGRHAPDLEGRIRFTSSPTTTFPSADVAGFSLEEDCMRLHVAFMGLVGISSPLPQYFAEHAMRLEDTGGPLRDFLDIFTSRIHALYYEAWRKHRLTGLRSTHPLSRMLAALTGAPLASGHPTRLHPAPRNADGLTHLLSSALNDVPVAIQQHIPRRIPLTERHALGHNLHLGNNALLGSHIRDASGAFRVLLGPVDRPTYETLRRDSPRIIQLAMLTGSYLDRPLDFDIAVRCAPQALETIRLGNQRARLGRTALLGKATRGRERTIIVHDSAGNSVR